MPPRPGRRPSQPAALGDHEWRVRAIERNRPTKPNPYAYLSTGANVNSVPIPAGLQEFYLFDIDGSLSGYEFTTNDSGIFANEEIEISGAAYFNPGTFHGLAINEPGRYKFTRSATSPVGVPTDLAMTLTLASGVNFSFSGMQTASPDRIIDEHISYMEIIDVTAPTGAIIPAMSNGTGSPHNAFVQLLVELLDDESHGFIL